MNRDETEPAANPSNCDDLVLQNGGTDSAGNIAQSTLFPDKTNLRNGDLTREFISCSSYFVNFRDTAEMKEVFIKIILYRDGTHFCVSKNKVEMQLRECTYECNKLSP